MKETLHLVPEWCFDILHEFLYQFQGFCQLRSATYIATAKFAVSSSNTSALSSSPDQMEEGGTRSSGNCGPPAHILDAIDVLSQNKDAWAVESVLTYLHRLVIAGTTKSSLSSGGRYTVIHPVYRYLAYFASVTLSRLECLLGDYRASITALDVIYDPNAELVAVGEEMKSPESLVNGVFPARLSLTYHAGVSYLMLRRYADSASTLGGICLFMQRGFKVSVDLRSKPCHRHILSISCSDEPPLSPLVLELLRLVNYAKFLALSNSTSFTIVCLPSLQYSHMYAPSQSSMMPLLLSYARSIPTTSPRSNWVKRGMRTSSSSHVPSLLTPLCQTTHVHYVQAVLWSRTDMMRTSYRYNTSCQKWLHMRPYAR